MNKQMKVCVHQPDFMPWQGFFKKIAASDIWVVLDSVENNPRDPALWCRRVKVLINGHAFWLSLPLKKIKGINQVKTRIQEIEYDLTKSYLFEKRLKTIEMGYKSARNFKIIFPIVESFFLSNNSNLLQRNVNFIKIVNRLLNINTKIVYSSETNIKSTSTKLLIDLVKYFGGNIYISGYGAISYQEDELFNKSKIRLIKNNFNPQPYSQLKSKVFVPGLSIIDALFNIDIEEVKRLIKWDQDETPM